MDLDSPPLNSGLLLPSTHELATCVMTSVGANPFTCCVCESIAGSRSQPGLVRSGDAHAQPVSRLHDLELDLDPSREHSAQVGNVLGLQLNAPGCWISDLPIDSKPLPASSKTLRDCEHHSSGHRNMASSSVEIMEMSSIHHLARNCDFSDLPQADDFQYLGPDCLMEPSLLVRSCSRYVDSTLTDFILNAEARGEGSPQRNQRLSRQCHRHDQIRQSELRHFCSQQAVGKLNKSRSIQLESPDSGYGTVISSSPSTSTCLSERGGAMLLSTMQRQQGQLLPTTQDLCESYSQLASSNEHPPPVFCTCSPDTEVCSFCRLCSIWNLLSTNRLGLLEEQAYATSVPASFTFGSDRELKTKTVRIPTSVSPCPRLRLRIRASTYYQLFMPEESKVQLLHQTHVLKILCRSRVMPKKHGNVRQVQKFYTSLESKSILGSKKQSTGLMTLERQQYFLH